MKEFNYSTNSPEENEAAHSKYHAALVVPLASGRFAVLTRQTTDRFPMIWKIVELEELAEAIRAAFEWQKEFKPPPRTVLRPDDGKKEISLEDLI